MHKKQRRMRTKSYSSRLDKKCSSCRVVCCTVTVLSVSVRQAGRCKCFKLRLLITCYPKGINASSSIGRQPTRGIMAIKLKYPTDQLTTLQHVQLIRRNISGKRVEIASRSLVTKIPRLSHKGSNTSKAQAC